MHEDVGVNLCVSVGTTVLLDCEVNADACPAPNVTWLSKRERERERERGGWKELRPVLTLLLFYRSRHSLDEWFRWRYYIPQQFSPH